MEDIDSELSKQVGVMDMITLQQLDEETLMSNLLQRYNADQIYVIIFKISYDYNISQTDIHRVYFSGY
jgi:hypothetical protein